MFENANETIIKYLDSIESKIERVNNRLKAQAMAQIRDKDCMTMLCPVCLNSKYTYRLGLKICCKCEQRLLENEWEK